MRSRQIISVLAGLFLPAALAAQDRSLPFTDPGWKLAGEGTRVATVDGRSALQVRTGGAQFENVRFRDGTIEFEMEVTPYRSFVYLTFRMESDAEYEELYFRPHKSGLPDAIQYSPVYGGVSNWQLYHGAGYTGYPRLPPGEWLRVRVVVEGSRAAVFVGDGEEPQLVIPQLARPAAAGYLAVRSFVVDPDLPADEPSARFANLVVRPGYIPFDFSQVESPAAAPAGTVTEWEVSAPFTADSGIIAHLPDVPPGGWRTLPTDHRGVLVLGRHVARPAGRPAIMARIRIPASSARTVPFDFGFSDDVSVFLNGRVLFHGDDSYRYDEPRRDGLIGFDQGRLYLALEPGTNDLVLVVTDVFGGWGVMGRFPSGRP